MSPFLFKFVSRFMLFSDGGGDGAGGGGGGSGSGDGGGGDGGGGGGDGGNDSGSGSASDSGVGSTGIDSGARGGEDGAGGFNGGFNGGPDAGFNGGPADGDASGYNSASNTGLSFSGFIDGLKTTLGYAAKGVAIASGGLPGLMAGLSVASDVGRSGLLGGLSSKGPSGSTAGFGGGGNGGNFSYNQPLTFTRQFQANGAEVVGAQIPVTAVKAAEEPVTPATEAAQKTSLTDSASGGVSSGWDWFKIVGGLASAVAIYKGLS